MLHQMRIELTVLLALSLAVAALVLALRGGGTGTTLVAGDAANGSKPVRIAADEAAGKVAIAAFQPKGHTVAIMNFAYDPDPVRVKAGQAVVWENFDGVPHTVTARDGSWDSGTLAQGEAAVITFDEPGVYAYICALHPPMGASIAGAADGERLVAGGGGHGMKGTIIVE